MIVKQPDQVEDPKPTRAQAGHAAERQMAFYLHRAFATDETVHVLNDLRLVDPDQPNPDGTPGVCQIDHLVLHRHGFFIVESKSVFDAVTVRGDGSGGDEWTRRFKGREHGFPSPIQQARRQGEFLRAYLHRHRESLLGLIKTGFRTIAKVALGSNQRGFKNTPIQIVVAVSDRGKIRRLGGWCEPDKPFQTFVAKADLVPEKIREQISTHRDAASLLGEIKGEYGAWAMKADELTTVATFLAGHHKSALRPSPSPAEPAVKHETRKAASLACCKSCGSDQLAAYWGQKAYRWKCEACGTSTPMPVTCSLCGRTGESGRTVRIRKDGPKYYRKCEPCGIEECLWVQR